MPSTLWTAAIVSGGLLRKIEMAGVPIADWSGKPANPLPPALIWPIEVVCNLGGSVSGRLRRIWDQPPTLCRLLPEFASSRQCRRLGIRRFQISRTTRRACQWWSPSEGYYPNLRTSIANHGFPTPSSLTTTLGGLNCGSKPIFRRSHDGPAWPTGYGRRTFFSGGEFMRVVAGVTKRGCSRNFFFDKFFEMFYKQIIVCGRFYVLMV